MAEGASPSVIPMPPSSLIRPIRPISRPTRGFEGRKRDDLRSRLVQAIEKRNGSLVCPEVKALVRAGKFGEIEAALKWAIDSEERPVEPKGHISTDYLLRGIAQALSSFEELRLGPGTQRIDEPAQIRELGRILLENLKYGSKSEINNVAQSIVTSAKVLGKPRMGREVPVEDREIHARVGLSIELLCEAHRQLEMAGKDGRMEIEFLHSVSSLRRMGPHAKKIGDAVFEKLIKLGTIKDPATREKNIGELALGEGATLLIPAGL